MKAQPGRWYCPWKWNVGLPLRLALPTLALLAAVSAALIVFVTIAFHIVIPQTIVVRTPPTGSPGPGGQVFETPGASDRLLTNRMRWTSTIGLLVMVPLGAASVYWLSRRGLRPVRGMAYALAQVAPERLSARVAVPEPPDDLKDLAVAVNDMLGRLEEASKRREEFVSNVAHELRTPLATLRTTLEVTLANGTSDKEDYRETLASMESSLSRLEALVDGLLLLAKRGPGTRERVLLGPLLDEVRLDLKLLAAQQKVTLKLQGDLDVEVQGDPVLLHRAFFNLVENGIRYNRPGGKVTLTLGRDMPWAMIVIADTGAGIAIEEQKYLFDRFYRANVTRSRFSKGVGLGLSIVKHVVEMHGGEVVMVSTPGEGSTFTVKLPLAPADEQPWRERRAAA